SHSGFPHSMRRGRWASARSASTSSTRGAAGVCQPHAGRCRERTKGDRGLTAARAEPIKIQRAWVGAAPRAVRNPTLWVLVVAVGIGAAAIGGSLTGRVPPAAAVLLDTVAAYLLFTVLHEATHGTAHPRRAVNATLGRVAGGVLTLAWPLFRAVHHEHHN